jgi:hypothetical protein
VTDDEVQQLMSRMDMNMDGQLEYDEVVTALIDWDTLHTDSTFGTAVDAVFAKLDKDRTGYLSPVELLPLLPTFLDDADDHLRELEVGVFPDLLIYLLSEFGLYHTVVHHITPPHPTVYPQHITSHRIASYHISPPHTAPYHIAPPNPYHSVSH